MKSDNTYQIVKLQEVIKVIKADKRDHPGFQGSKEVDVAGVTAL